MTTPKQFLKKYQTQIIWGLIGFFVLMAFNPGMKAQFFGASIFGAFGGSGIIGILLLALGLGIIIFTAGAGTPIGIVLIIGAALTGGSAVLGSLTDFIQTGPGIIVIGVVLFAMFLIFRR